MGRENKVQSEHSFINTIKMIKFNCRVNEDNLPYAKNAKFVCQILWILLIVVGGICAIGGLFCAISFTDIDRTAAWIALGIGLAAVAAGVPFLIIWWQVNKKISGLKASFEDEE